MSFTFQIIFKTIYPDNKKALKAFDKIVKGTREILRSDRKIERKQHPKSLYYMNYKRL
jgi:hypothetical protein